MQLLSYLYPYEFATILAIVSIFTIAFLIYGLKCSLIYKKTGNKWRLVVAVVMFMSVVFLVQYGYKTYKLHGFFKSLEETSKTKVLPGPAI